MNELVERLQIRTELLDGYLLKYIEEYFQLLVRGATFFSPLSEASLLETPGPT